MMKIILQFKKEKTNKLQKLFSGIYKTTNEDEVLCYAEHIKYLIKDDPFNYQS